MSIAGVNRTVPHRLQSAITQQPVDTTEENEPNPDVARENRGVAAVLKEIRINLEGITIKAIQKSLERNKLSYSEVMWLLTCHIGLLDKKTRELLINYLKKNHSPLWAANLGRRENFLVAKDNIKELIKYLSESVSKGYNWFKYGLRRNPDIKEYLEKQKEDKRLERVTV